MSQPVYKRVFKMIFRYWPYLTGSTVAAFLYVAFNSLSIWFIASLLNNILADFDTLLLDHRTLQSAADLSLNEQFKYWTNQLILRDTAVETLQALCITILIIFLLKNVFLYIKNVLIVQVQFRFITELRDQLYAHLHSLTLAFFNKQKSGELTSIIVTDVENMRRAFSVGFQRAFVEPINILAFIILLFIINVKLALIATIIIPFSAIAIITIGRSIRRKSRRTAVKIAGITNIITETLGAMRIVKAFFMKQYEISRFQQQTKKYFQLITRRAQLRLIASPSTESIAVIIAVILLWIGGKDVLIGHELTAEDFIRFILILFSALAPIRLLSNVSMELQMGMASAERVFRMLDTEPEIIDIPGARTKSDFKDKVEFKNVQFQYPEVVDQVLQDISFSIIKGQIVALVGESGAGKSTIADLIPRFYDVTGGDIEIDSISIKELTVRSLRQLMGIVTQETILFDDTIRANIAYGLNDIEDERILAAANTANAIEFIHEQPQGLDTIIGERGVKLSGGQKQRIAIARAILKNPPILILDEATSSLDTKSEKLVQEALENLMADRTVLVIAHRLSTIQRADQILVLSKGKIVESGRHKELMQKGSLYKDYYDIQLKQTQI
jgi:subfamily B ATP-binding cassette protein MsbA